MLSSHFLINCPNEALCFLNFRVLQINVDSDAITKRYRLLTGSMSAVCGVSGNADGGNEINNRGDNGKCVINDEMAEDDNASD